MEVVEQRMEEYVKLLLDQKERLSFLGQDKVHDKLSHKIKHP